MSFPKEQLNYSPLSEKDAETKAYEASILAEIADELENHDHLIHAGVQIVCFSSFSKGRGRKTPRREVILIKYAGQTHQFSRERYPIYRNADSDAEEIYASHKENGHDPYDIYFDAILSALSKR